MNFIVAVDQSYGIGYMDKLLTHVPDDLKYFKKMTLGNIIIMGRKTLEALPGGKPLTGRTTIVLTKNMDYYNEDVIIVHGLDELFKCLKDFEDDKVFVAGGEAIYQQLIPYCEFGYITFLQDTFKADKHMLPIREMPEWQKIWESEVNNHNGLAFTFTQYKNGQILTRP